MLQVAGLLGGEEAINPVMAMLDDVENETVRHSSEAFFGLRASFGRRALVVAAIRHVALHFCPQQLDRLHLRTEWRRVDERVAFVAHELLDHGAVVVWMFLQKLVHSG